jgi:hypothetical protein
VGQYLFWCFPDVFKEFRIRWQNDPPGEGGNLEQPWSGLECMVTVLDAFKRKYLETHYSLIASFEHASCIKVKTESREIGENRVGKSYGGNSFELPKKKVNRLATGIIRGHGTDQGISLSVPARKQRDHYKNAPEERPASEEGLVCHHAVMTRWRMTDDRILFQHVDHR